MTTYVEAMEALGDGTRREIFERLAQGPAAVGELAAGLPVSRPAVSQHLRVLKAAGLVTDHAAGTRRIYALEPDGIAAMREYWERVWSGALEWFRAVAEDEKEKSRDRDD